MKLRILPIIASLCVGAVLAQTYPHLFVTKRASASAPPVLYDYDSVPHPMDSARVRSIVHDTSSALRALIAAREPALGNPASNGQALVSTTGGVRSWASMQPLDADLTAIAALSTQSFGRSLLTQADAPTARATLGAQAALGYTPVNKSGDTMTGALAVATATGGVTVGTDTSTATEVLLKAASASQAQLRLRLASGDGLRLYSSATEGGIASVDGGTANYPLTFVKGDVNGLMTIRRPLNVAANLSVGGVQRISTGGAGTLTTLGTTGLATLNALKVTGQAGTGNRLVQASSDGTQSASIPVPTAFMQTLFDDADQAAARATLGAQGLTLLSQGSDQYVAYGTGEVMRTLSTVVIPAASFNNSPQFRRVIESDFRIVSNSPAQITLRFALDGVVFKSFVFPFSGLGQSGFVRLNLHAQPNGVGMAEVFCTESTPPLKLDFVTGVLPNYNWTIERTLTVTAVATGDFGIYSSHTVKWY